MTRPERLQKRAAVTAFIQLLAAALLALVALAPGPARASVVMAPPREGRSLHAATSRPRALLTAASSTSHSGITHVAIINLENKGYNETFGTGSAAPYLARNLRARGELLSHYYAIGHFSLANYIAEISGQAPNPSTQADCLVYQDFVQTGTARYGQAVGRGCVYPSSVKTVGDQLAARGLTWKSYQEDMGSSPSEAPSCAHPLIGQQDATFLARTGDSFTTRHDPFVYFHSIIDSPRCSSEVVALGQLSSDLAQASSTPNLVFITPSLCHTGHDAPCQDGEPGGLASANLFLSEWVPRLLSAPAFRQHGLVIITFDEAETSGPDEDDTACCHEPTGPNVSFPGQGGPGGGRIGAVLIGAGIKPGTVDNTPYNHYALLCSVENVFGLSHLGMAAQPGLRCFGKDVYQARTS